jgi:hypothetical protein
MSTKAKTEVIIEIHQGEGSEGNYRAMQGHATRAFMKKYRCHDAESLGLIEIDGEIWRYQYVIYGDYWEA